MYGVCVCLIWWLVGWWLDEGDGWLVGGLIRVIVGWLVGLCVSWVLFIVIYV